MKQVLLIRKDLGMRRGKEIAQGAHASMKATLENMEDPRVIEWLAGSFAKIALVVNSEEELLSLYEDAKAKGMVSALITDNGRTEFGGIPTNTVVAIGPDEPEAIDAITGHLKLR